MVVVVMVVVMMMMLIVMVIVMVMVVNMMVRHIATLLLNLLTPSILLIGLICWKSKVAGQIWPFERGLLASFW